MHGWRRHVPIVAMMVLFFAVYSFLPSAMVRSYASPDETAHAVMTEEIAVHGRVSRSDSQVFTFPWLHPRSWASQGTRVVPVGFLGWSVFLVPWYWLLGPHGLPWIGAFIFASGIWPFFHLLARHFGGGERRARQGALLATLITWSFPAFIVYGNRGLFANGPVLVFFLWGLWLLMCARRLETGERRRNLFLILATVCIGLALTIRPVEFIWMLPWLLWGVWGMKVTRTEICTTACALLITILPATILAYQAYGAWFTVGYWIHDHLLPTDVLRSAVSPAISGNEIRWLPYGFHPRHMWWNVSSFFLHRLWMWIIPTMGIVSFCVVQERRRWLMPLRRMISVRWVIPLLLSGWTTMCLLVLYGSGLYNDHVRIGAVAIANSFLRYTLPIACFVGIVIGLVFVHTSARWVRRMIVSWSVLLVIMGVQQAFIADDEGLWKTRAELIRYENIREKAENVFSPDAVLFSERSDKVFFPTFRAVSPLPKPQEMSRLARQHVEIGLFARPLSQQQKDDWRESGFDVQEVASFGRERLYKLLLPTAL